MKSPIIEAAEKELSEAQREYQRSVSNARAAKAKFDAARKKLMHLEFVQMEIEIELARSGGFKPLPPLRARR